MQWQLAGLAKLPVANTEQAIGDVEISLIELNRFPDAHTCDRQQTD
jgi:hypothetical protein